MRMRKNVKVAALLLSFGVLLYVGKSNFSLYALKTFFHFYDIAVFHDLCIEPEGRSVKLVVYNSVKDEAVNISVSTGVNYKGRHADWTVHFSSLPLPTGQQYTHSRAAFFVSTTCEANFHHFWHDTVNGLFGAMKLTNTLGSHDASQLYYITDIWHMGKTECHDPSRFQEILYALPVRKEHVYYRNAKPRSCYMTAVLGDHNKGYTTEEKRNHFKQYFNITCPVRSKTRVTIINRQHRSILNTDELQEAVKKAGFEPAVVFMSKLSIREQFNVVVCTDILVGIQGAGLRWIDFLPAKSALLELTWNNWPPFYIHQAEKQGKKAAKLSAKHVILNLPTYFKMVHGTSPNITKNMLSMYYDKPPVSEGDNHWKWADVTFDPEEFVAKLEDLKYMSVYYTM